MKSETRGRRSVYHGQQSMKRRAQCQHETNNYLKTNKSSLDPKIEGSKRKDERFHRVTLQETLRIMGLLVVDDLALLEDEELMRAELQKMVTVEVLTVKIHWVHKAIVISKEETRSLLGPLPILTLTVHKMRNLPDPHPNILSIN